MVDITIETDVKDGQQFQGLRLGIIWKDDGGTGFVFYLHTTGSLEIRKTTDGGDTWADLATVSASNIKDYSARAEDESGITSTRILIAYIDETNAKVAFRALDMADDTLSVEVDVATGLDVAPGNDWRDHCIDVVRTRGLNLYIPFTTDRDAGANRDGFYRSVDGGATWAARSTAGINRISKVWIFPGNEADLEDVLLVDLQFAAQDLGTTLYDNSADTWGVRAILADNATDGVVFELLFIQGHGVHRQSDDHALFSLVTDVDIATSDLLTFDITNPTTVTQKANVLTNQAEFGAACLWINQQNDNVRCSYLRGGTWSSKVDAYYKLSTDGMDSWEIETQLSVTDDDHKCIYSGGFVDAAGGRFMPMWLNEDLDDLITNKDNSIEIPAAPPPPPPPPGEPFPEYGQLRTAIGDPPVYGATILRS